jgi:hypothetical protein
MNRVELDYESKSTYSLIIKAYDPLSSTKCLINSVNATVRIDIIVSKNKFLIIYLF